MFYLAMIVMVKQSFGYFVEENHLLVVFELQQIDYWVVENLNDLLIVKERRIILGKIIPCEGTTFCTDPGV